MMETEIEGAVFVSKLQYNSFFVYMHVPPDILEERIRSRYTLTCIIFLEERMMKKVFSGG